MVKFKKKSSNITGPGKSLLLKIHFHWFRVLEKVYLKNSRLLDCGSLKKFNLKSTLIGLFVLEKNYIKNTGLLVCGFLKNLRLLVHGSLKKFT